MNADAQEVRAAFFGDADLLRVGQAVVLHGGYTVFGDVVTGVVSCARAGRENRKHAARREQGRAGRIVLFSLGESEWICGYYLAGEGLARAMRQNMEVASLIA